ncbi:MAG: hydrogenase [Epsilonproteobacteria bacterium]|nr:hydrogenase [Campylobacterota bacterium]
MIRQKIKYISPNCYFAGFLQNIINKSGIKGEVEQKDKEIILKLDDSNEELLYKFSELSTKELPHSIFIEDIKTEVVDEEIGNNKIECPPCNISLCPKCLEDISNPASSHYLDDSLLCTHYSNKEPFYYSDTTNFSPHYSPGASILVCDASKIDELFILTNEEKKLLFSIEKPTIKATIKSEEIKELTNRNFIDIKAPYNTRSTLVAINAKDAQMPYLFFNGGDDLKIVKVQDSFSIIRANRVAKKLENLNSNPTLNRFENLAKEANYSEAVGANLSTKAISFIVKSSVDTIEPIRFSKFSLQETLEKMQKDEIRGKLLKNFEKKFEPILKELYSKEYDLFEALSIILEVNEIGFKGLSEKSLEFLGNGGLKIDLYFKDGNLDYSALLGSVMSFKLAGAENHYIAYSIFEAIGDMAISVLNQLKREFSIKNTIFMGDMFENSVLYSRILSKYQLSNPYFSKTIALDD